MQVYKQTGRKPQALAEMPEFPKSMMDLWQWFEELLSTGPLTYTEIRNWADLMRYKLLPEEVQALRRLYSIYRSAMNG